MPVTEKDLKALRELKAKVYLEMRAFERGFKPTFNYPVVAFMETHLWVENGQFKAKIHGRNVAFWELQEMPDVVWTAFRLMRQQILAARPKGYTGGKPQISEGADAE